MDEKLKKLSKHMNLTEATKQPRKRFIRAFKDNPYLRGQELTPEQVYDHFNPKKNDTKENY